METNDHAHGGTAYWASSAKTGVGTALNAISNVWFTLSHGILTEVFHPFVDIACTRDLELIVTDRQSFVSEEKKGTQSQVTYLSPGVPAYKVVNTCSQKRYRVEKLVLSDPERPTVFQQVHFLPLQGKLTDYSVYVVLRPHLENQGADNTAWIGDYKGVPMLFAQRNFLALALACSATWKTRAAGYNRCMDAIPTMPQLTQTDRKDQQTVHGNVVLCGEVDLTACDGRFLLALSFGRDMGAAGYRARASLLQGIDAAQKKYVQAWSDWHSELLPMEGVKQHSQHLYHISAAVMRIHEDKHFSGGIIASLSTPWGFSKKDGEMGYHLVWPRDMIETIGGLLAVQKHEDARRVLSYFQVTQGAEGCWPQNMFTNGKHFWNGKQLDETAFVIRLVDLARQENALQKNHLAGLWPMVRLAASYLVRHGPVTPMDRWEEEAGYFPSTMAVEIAALLAAADLADLQGESALGTYLRETADSWNDAIDHLVYVTGTELARKCGVDGYYVRFALPNQLLSSTPAAGSVTLKNHLSGQGYHAVAEIVSPDALTLVRFGLRAADDPRIINTVKVIDQLLKVNTPHGPCWHRYTDDGYGEHADGAPFDGTGIGRCWPLLTGERAHYELAAGRHDYAEELLRAMEGFANDSGLFPEQIWDSPAIPERELYFGRPSGSAMPLVWAHAEYVKLRRSLKERRVFDMPHQTVQRYLVEKTGSPFTFWRFDQQCRYLPSGNVLRMEVLASAVVHWSTDGWRTKQDSPTRDTGIGIHLIDLPTENLAVGTSVVFTFYWADAGRWEGQDFIVTVEQSQLMGRSTNGVETKPNDLEARNIHNTWGGGSSDRKMNDHGHGIASNRRSQDHRKHKNDRSKKSGSKKKEK